MRQLLVGRRVGRRDRAPLASSVFASTALPRVESLGSTTSWANVRLPVPLPLS